jgi:FkbM family methyltransferase
MEDLPDTREDELQRKLNRLRRRQERNERAAWAKGFLTAVCGMLKPGDLAIDCGANVGDVSARLLASGADVIAFDPEPWAVAKLNNRFKGEARFTLHNAAVGTQQGTIRLYRAGNFENNEKNASVKSTILGGGRMIDYEDGSAVDVRVIDFVAFLRDCIAKRGEIAFLKIDIEGAELDLLRAMDAADVFPYIRCTVVETHEKKFRDLKDEFASLRRDFAEKYRPEHVNLDWI